MTQSVSREESGYDGIFDDLLNLCGEWEGRLIKYKTESWQLVHKLANGFSQYIGAPNTYDNFDGSPSKRYVVALEATRISDNSVKFS